MRRACFFVVSLMVAGCAHRAAPVHRGAQSGAVSSQPRFAAGSTQSGYATWYGASLAGHRTASGERFDPSQLTAAHRTLPLGTWVDVRRPDTGRMVRVRINDRGPYGSPDRIIDISRAAADELQMVRAGVVFVELSLIEGR